MVLPIGPQTLGTRNAGTVADRVTSGAGFAPIIAILPRQLQTNLLQQLAGQTTAARLLSLTAGGTALIDVRGTPLEVRLKNVPTGQNPGDTVLLHFRTEESADETGVTAGRAGGAGSGGSVRNAEALRTDAQLAGRAATGALPVSSEQQLSDTARLLGTLSRIENAAEVPFTIDVVLTADEAATSTEADASPLLRLGGGSIRGAGLEGTAGSDATQTTDQAIARYAAQTLQDMVKAIETSGLFYESHLAQWNEGERSEADLRAEPQATWGAEDSMDESTLPDASQPRESVRHVAAQLGQLERPALHMTLPGFFNDRVYLSIQRDEPPRPRDIKQPPAWFATLRMDLPHLGPLEMRITLLDSECTVRVSSSAESRSVVSAGFRELMDAMSAAGLKLNAQASASATTEVARDR